MVLDHILYLQILAYHPLVLTINTPFRIAPFGIFSPVSIIEDNLVEIMRRYYYRQIDKTLYPDSPRGRDRPRRITDYLNLIDSLVREQVNQIKSSTFEKGSYLVKYFEMLPAHMYIREL